MGMKKHVTALGAFFIALSALNLFAALFVFVAIAGGGLLSGEREAIAITSAVGTFIASILAVLAVPGLIAGIGLLNLRPWARLLGLILSFINLLHIPLGTILGIYGIWVLLNDEASALFGKQPPGGGPA